jgi:hypothetical protein
MLATIDDETERKIVADRRKHGMAYMRVLQDGRIEHVPIGEAPPAHAATALPWLRRVG